MQRINVKKVQPIGKDGTAVFNENGTRFSGFQPELKCVRVGDILGIDVEVKGKFNNISAVKFFEHGVEGRSQIKQRGVDYYARERESIEAQTAFKGIIELACHISVEGKLGVAYDKALDWAIARLREKAELKPVISIIKTLEKSTGNYIDTEWLKKALKTLQSGGAQGWSNAAVIAGLNKITGSNAQSVTEALKPLNRKQATQFVREVRLALEKG